MTSPQSLRSPSEDTHFRVLRELHAHPRITQRELAKKLGVSLGATNYLLRAFLQKGVIKMQNFQASRKKLAYVYILTPEGLAEKARLASLFLHRKREEYEALRAEIEALSESAPEPPAPEPPRQSPH